jgi:hypothetical protein
MKIVNVKVIVQITEVADYQEAPPEPEAEKFNDDPLDKQEKILNKYADRILGAQRPAVTYYAGESNGLSLSLNFSVLTSGFEELQGILARFEMVSKAIHEAAPAPAQQAAGFASPPFPMG